MTRTELADVMLKGLQTDGVTESRRDYIATREAFFTCSACALGCALIGHRDGDYVEAEEIYDAEYLSRGDKDFEFEIFADLLEIPSKLAIKVERRHLNGQTVEQIAAWLKGEG